MLHHTRLEHRFVQFFPEQLESGVIYISIEYATAAHSCCCGCGEQVITPFTPTDWKLTFDGETISLWPSIGNWNFRCRSHYIIRNSRVLAAEPWEDLHVGYGPRGDKKHKHKHYAKDRSEQREPDSSSKPRPEPLGIWDRLKRKVHRCQRRNESGGKVAV
jgi:hypothetical protein